MTNKISWGNDVGDILAAIDNAQSAITDALEEIRGLGELMDVYGALEDSMKELDEQKCKYEDYMTGEYQAQIAEQNREYYRSVI